MKKTRPTPAFASQKALALRLELTDRRIRQLVDEKVLPEPRDGRFDVARCFERYRLFRSKDPDAWAEYFDQVTRDAGEVEKLVAAALEPSSKKAEVTAASCAVQSVVSDLEFITAARSKTDGEREFVWSIWRAKADEALRLLLGRAVTIIAAESGRTVAEVQDALLADTG
jgi:hypothetical protein